MPYLVVVLVMVLAGEAWGQGAPVKIDGGDAIVPITDVFVGTTATVVSQSNKNRVALNCTTSGDVRWGGSSITSTRGQIAPAGASIEIRNTAAIYMIAVAGVSTLSCTEEVQSSSSSNSIFSP